MSLLTAVWSLGEGGFEARLRGLRHDDGQKSLCVLEERSCGVVVRGNQVRLIDTEDHVTDRQTGLFGGGSGLDVRYEDTASQIRVFALDDHDAQSECPFAYCDRPDSRESMVLFLQCFFLQVDGELSQRLDGHLM